MYCPSFDIKCTRFWTIAILKETYPPQKCCHTTDGILPFSLWMFAVSTAVCCVQCCCCIQTFTSPHFSLTVNMHGDGRPDRRVLVYSFRPTANILTYFPTITRHVHHWHKTVENLQSKKLKKGYSVLCDVTQRPLVFIYRRFGITHRSNLQTSRSPRLECYAWTLKIGSTAYHETSGTKYQNTLLDFLKELRS